MDLNGKTALVTGAAQGIGSGCARCLEVSGARVVRNDLDMSKFANDEPLGIYACGDMFTPHGRDGIVYQTIRQVGAIDIAVLNPYRSIRNSSLNMSDDAFCEVMNGTLVSHFALSRDIATHMVSKNVEGSIIFISSIYGRLNRSGSIAYDTAKAGIEQMMRVFARELAPHRIRVNAVAPGWTDTPGERQFADDVEITEASLKIPLGRMCTPEDIGEAVVFLAGAKMVTGITLSIDGGMGLPSSTLF